VPPSGTEMAPLRGFVFCSLFAFSSEKCIFVAIRDLNVVDSERVASLRLSFELRLEKAVRGLFSLPLKCLPEAPLGAGLPKIGEAGCRQKEGGQAGEKACPTASATGWQECRRNTCGSFWAA
jgi:hypothetical protein